MADSISLTPSDIVGAIQRGLTELHTYLQQPPASIDVGACVTHLGQMIERLETLAEMQGVLRQHQAAANGNGAETRTN